MNTFDLKILLVLFLLLLVSGNVFSHGVKLKTEEKPPFLVVQAAYSGHHEISGMKMMIYSPDSEELYQEGKTDIHGKFSFTPDRTGTWKIVADDGMGHKKSIEISLIERFFSPEEETAREVILAEESHAEVIREFTFAEIPSLYRIIFGLAIILGLTGILFGVMSKTKTR